MGVRRLVRDLQKYPTAALWYDAIGESGTVRAWTERNWAGYYAIVPRYSTHRGPDWDVRKECICGVEAKALTAHMHACARAHAMWIGNVRLLTPQGAEQQKVGDMFPSHKVKGRLLDGHEGATTWESAQQASGSDAEGHTTGRVRAQVCAVARPVLAVETHSKHKRLAGTERRRAELDHGQGRAATSCPL